MPAINKAIGLLNVSPINKKQVNNQNYLQNKIQKVNKTLIQSLKVLKESDEEINSKNFLEMIEQLKIKFNDSNTMRSEKIQILTLLPETWSLSRICHTMGCTKHMASKAKSLREENGILSTPYKKLGFWQIFYKNTYSGCEANLKNLKFFKP